VRDLYNLLQKHLVGNGNLTQYFSWALSQTGPVHQTTHYATAELHGEEIGSGTGFSMGNAKREAATEALKYLRAQGY